jgi:predicted neutral ceramidase superfamily lipid hydrolase
MSGLFWWAWQIVLILLGSFFLYYGVELLISAYGLNDPYTFIMTFFASNFIILISAALIVGFVYRMVAVYRQLKNTSSGSNDSKNNSTENRN